MSRPLSRHGRCRAVLATALVDDEQPYEALTAYRSQIASAFSDLDAMKRDVATFTRKRGEVLWRHRSAPTG